MASSDSGAGQTAVLEGYWLPHTANHDFCEPNYVHSYYITEFFNSTSSTLVIHAGIYLAWQAQQLYWASQKQEKLECQPTGVTSKDDADVAHSSDPRRTSKLSNSYSRLSAWFPYTALMRARFLGFAFVLIGIGSVWFHGTLTRAGQICDELPMVLFAILAFYVLHRESTEGLGYSGAVLEWARKVVGRTNSSSGSSRGSDSGTDPPLVNIVDLTKSPHLRDIANIYERFMLADVIIQTCLGAFVYFSFAFWVFIVTYVFCILRCTSESWASCRVSDEQMRGDAAESGVAAHQHRRSLRTGFLFIARALWGDVIEEKLQKIEDDFAGGLTEKNHLASGNARKRVTGESDAKQTDLNQSDVNQTRNVEEKPSAKPPRGVGMGLAMMNSVLYIGGTVFCWIPVEVFCEQIGKPILSSVDFISLLLVTPATTLASCLCSLVGYVSGLGVAECWALIESNFGSAIGLLAGVPQFLDTHAPVLRSVNVMVFCHPIFHVTSAMGCMSLGQVQMWVGIRSRGSRPVLHKGTIWSLGIPIVGLSSSCEGAAGNGNEAGGVIVAENGAKLKGA